jgi:hypothetical protein
LPSYSTSTDSSGQFVFQRPPGDYLITATKESFVRESPELGIPIRLTSDSTLQPLEIRMTPQSAIAGRVIDGDGDPVENATVNVLQPKYVKGQRRLQSPGRGGSATTNDRGEYRIFGLAPGKYYLKASSPISPTAQHRPSTAPAADNYVISYHPGTMDSKSAVGVVVAAGTGAEGVDILLVRGRTVSIRGRVNNQTAIDSKGLVVIVSSEDPGSWAEAKMGPQGTFEARGLSPGIYQVQVGIAGGGTARPSARVELRVGRDDIGGVVVNLLDASELAGQLVLEGPGTLQPPSLQLHLQATGGVTTAYPGAAVGVQGVAMTGPGPVDATLRPDGKFLFNRVNADRYLVNVSGMPPDYYLKSVALDGEDVTIEGLDFTAGARGNLVVVVSNRTGQAEGVVLNKERKPVKDATVVLVPQAPKLRSRADLYKIARSDSEGKFSMRGIAPGTYKIFAWDVVDDTAWLNEEFMEPFAGKGTELVVRDGATERVELVVLVSP